MDFFHFRCYPGKFSEITLLKSLIDVLCKFTNFEFIPHIQHQPYLIKLVNSFQAIPFEKLYERTKTKDFCFSVERLPYGSPFISNFSLIVHIWNCPSHLFTLGHYAVGDYIDEASLSYLRLMHYDIYFEYCVAMFHKTWPFKSVFDLLVLNIVESGIQKYWELMVKCFRMNVLTSLILILKIAVSYDLYF